MKILSPLDNIGEVEKLAEAGAGEFYCGLIEEEWYEKYPVISINRRPAGKGHFRKFGDLKEAVKRSHQIDIPVYFAINEHYYTNAQYPLLTRYIEEAIHAGVDAFIVSDYGLMAYITEKGYPVSLHMSTGGTVFNWRAVKFFKDIGAERITFTRHLTLDEIGEIIPRMPPIDTTVFVLNSRCINVDGFCTFQHGLAGKKIFPMFRNACMLQYHVTAHCNTQEESDITCNGRTYMLERQKIWEKVHVDDHPCGACAMYEFREMGITGLKIVGRGNPLERKVKDVLFIKNLMDYLNGKTPSKEDFRGKAQNLYQETYRRPCRMHMCYYPSVMLSEDTEGC